jgi:hypothetical protein
MLLWDLMSAVPAVRLVTDRLTERVPECSEQELRRADLDSMSAIMAVCVCE